MGRAGIMLAQPFEEKRLVKWGSGPFIIQPKLDGERCRALFDARGVVTLLSSEENVITSVPHINEQLEMSGLCNVELDGELYVHGDSFEHIHSIVSRKVNQHFNSYSMQFHVFDIVEDNVPQQVRLRALDELLKGYEGMDSIIRVPVDYVTSDLETIMEALIRYKSQGYEGLIIRHPMAPYVRKRSPYMMKFKPKKNDIYKIVGYKEEISIHGTPKGRMGAFILEGDDGTQFAVGSGFNDNDRFFFWQNREELIGKWCEVQYQHITTKGKVPRFPIFVKVRVDLL